MKITQPITVAGYYRQSDDQWQSAPIVTDGVEVVEVLDTSIAETPDLQAADLAGVEAALGADMPLDPQQIAVATGSAVVSDFRGSDMAMGGQGTPLHPFYLHALARMSGEGVPLAYLVAGDALSLVWVDPRVDQPTDPRAITCFETGFGFAALHNIPETKERGEVVDGALELFLDDPYFRRLPPKRVSPDNFGPLMELVGELSPSDARTTLLGMAATSVLLAQEHLPKAPSKLVLLGEGATSGLMKDLLRAALDMPVEVPQTVDPLTINAQAIAYLAARVAQGLPTTAPHTTQVAAAVGGGTMTESP